MDPVLEAHDDKSISLHLLFVSSAFISGVPGPLLPLPAVGLPLGLAMTPPFLCRMRMMTMMAAAPAAVR